MAEITVAELDLKPERIVVRDKLALVVKINSMQQKMESFAEQLNQLAAELMQATDTAVDSASQAQQSAGAAQAAAAGDVIDDTQRSTVMTHSSEKLGAALDALEAGVSKLEVERVTFAKMVAYGVLDG